MSTDWDIVCVDCLRAGKGRAVHLGLDWNHGHDSIVKLITEAQRLAVLHDLVLSIDSVVQISVKVCYDRYLPLEWFAEHAHHRLTPRNEYGDIDGICGKWVDCTACAGTCKQECEVHDGFTCLLDAQWERASDEARGKTARHEGPCDGFGIEYKPSICEHDRTKHGIYTNSYRSDGDPRAVNGMVTYSYPLYCKSCSSQIRYWQDGTARQI